MCINIVQGPVWNSETSLSPADRSKVVLLLWIFFMNFVFVCLIVLSVSCSLVVTCWEMTGLLALMYMYVTFCCVFATYPYGVLVQVWTSLYRFLIFAFFFISIILSIKLITKPLIRLRGCTGWSASLLLASFQQKVFQQHVLFTQGPLRA